MLLNYSTDMWNETDELDHDKFHEIDFLYDHLMSLTKNFTILIMIFTIMGNTLVLVATWRERSLHQPNKYFVACLAVADLSVGVFVAPLWLYFTVLMINDDDDHITSIHLCRFIVWIDTCTLLASIYTLTFISFDRYLKISKPFLYKSRMTTSTSLKVIFTIWLISIAFATYAATPHSGSNGVFLTARHCPMFEPTKPFYTFLTVSAFFLPATVIVIMYILIFRVAYKRKTMLRNGELGENCNDRNQQTAFVQDLKVIRMLLIVTGVFILCWGPFFVYLLLSFYVTIGPTDDDSLSTWYGYEISEFVIFTLPLFNSLCNPIIYTYLDQSYGRAFKLLLRQLICQDSSRRDNVQ